MSDVRKVCVLGLGYIGLPTASLLATKGYEVHGVDVKPDVVSTINEGRIHIREPELDVLVRSAVQSGHLKASLEPAAADVFIISVPTPFKDGYVPDVTYVEVATRSAARCLGAGNLVILESTSPVGTTESVAQWIVEERPDLGSGQVYVAHCPERVLPGQIIRELVSNDRIVGGVDSDSTRAAEEFYREFVSGEVLVTDSRTAELVKLAENTFRDVNIALANELSLICDELGVDVWHLIDLANHHPRVNILRPGPGVGGHCLAVDPWFIVDSAPQLARLIRVAREVNNAKPASVVDKVRRKAARIHDPTIACLGLAYKPDIDDLRESPAVAITRELAASGVGHVLAVEPHITELPRPLQDTGVGLADFSAALAQADIVVCLVAHRLFREHPPTALNEKIVIDVCGGWR